MKADERKRLRNWLKEIRFSVTGAHGFNEVIMTRSGVSTREVNPKTKQSKKAKGLYIAGELLDVEADTGG